VSAKPRIVVISSCTGEKIHRSDEALTLDDFRKGPAHVGHRENELADLLTPAQDLYSGQQHVRLMRGVHGYQSANGEKADMNLWILSAGYGLIPGDQELVPYECTFQNMKKAELRSWADELNVPGDIRRVLAQPYDLGIVLLGDSYLEASALDASVQLGGPTILFCGSRMAARLPDLPNLRIVVLSNEEAKRFSCGLVGLKGEVAARMLEGIRADTALVEQLHDRATDVLSTLEEKGVEEKPKKTRPKARPNPSVDRIIDIPDSWWQKPHRKKFSYFIPEWDDLVDPDYDFETDTHSGGSGDWSNEAYAHQIYREPNYDGILISKVVAEKSRKKKERINKLGVHRYLRVPREFPIMGDCGAFGYIQEDVPPYTTDEILDYYTRLGFDYGVSIDHLIVKFTEAQKQERYELTIHNAEEFLRGHGQRALSWEPIGAVQGWDPKSYTEAARQYVAMGYRYIALGGMVRSTTAEILRVLVEVRQVVPETVKIHVFGVARLAALAQFQRLGVRSVDSASYLRQAWMRESQGYLTETGDSYASIRIPAAGKSFRAKRMVSEGRAAAEYVEKMERNCLRVVQDFDKGRLSVDETLDVLEEYDRLITSNRKDTRSALRRTLEARPWEACSCAICRTDGIQVVIFRGNNRNRRRGFHNTYAFYRLLQRMLNGEVTNPVRDSLEPRQLELPLQA
jgi:hypothetical protein